MKKNNEILNDFFELDKNQRIPLALTFRLLFSKKCRNLVRLLTKAEKLASKPVAVQVPVTDESITAVLQKLSPEFEAASSRSPFPLSRWIFAGVAMIGLMITFGILTKSSSSQTVVLPFYFLFATVVTSYCALFIGCNMDFFVKQIETRKLSC